MTMQLGHDVDCGICSDTKILQNPFTREQFPCPACGERPPIRVRPALKGQDANAIDLRVHLFVFNELEREELTGVMQVRAEGELLTVRVTCPGDPEPVEGWRSIDSRDPAVSTFLSNLIDALRDIRVRGKVTT